MNDLDLTMSEELFNPSEYTQTELLKLVYRELHQLKNDFEEYKNNNNYNVKIQALQIEVNDLRNELRLEKELKEANRKKTQSFIAIAGLLIIAAELIIKFLI